VGAAISRTFFRIYLQNKRFLDLQYFFFTPYIHIGNNTINFRCILLKFRELLQMKLLRSYYGSPRQSLLSSHYLPLNPFDEAGNHRKESSNAGMKRNFYQAQEEDLL
jgi:hypothetical protein